MEDVKESVRQGVTKVAGKLSGMASGVMTQLQVKFGFLYHMVVTFNIYAFPFVSTTKVVKQLLIVTE